MVRTQALWGIVFEILAATVLLPATALGGNMPGKYSHPAEILTDGVIAYLLRGLKEQLSLEDHRHLLSSSGALDDKAFFFDALIGVKDTVISAYEKNYRLIVANPPWRKNLRDMNLTFRVAIYPYKEKTRVRGIFEKRGIRVNPYGVLDEVIPISEFYESDIVHYTVALSYETLFNNAVEIKRFHLTLSATPEKRIREFKDGEEILKKALLDSIVLSKSAKNWQPSEQLREDAENMNRYVLVSDFSDVEVSTTNHFPSKSLQFFQAHQDITEKAGICLMITADGKPPRDIRIPHYYTVISLWRYQTLYEPLLEALQELDSWDIHSCKFDPNVPYRGVGLSVISSYVFTKYALESPEIIRTLARPQFFFRNLDHTLQLYMENQGGIDKAQVYLTPLVEGTGFVYPMGEQYEPLAQEEKLKIPLSIKEFPVSSWHYRVDVHTRRGGHPEYIRFSMAVLDSDNIHRITVVQFPENNDRGVHQNLLERANQYSYCEEGKYCPLLIINPPSGISGSNLLPSRAVILSREEAENLPTDMFTGMQGVIWQAAGMDNAPQAMSGFAKFTVTTKVRQRRYSI